MITETVFVPIMFFSAFTFMNKNVESKVDSSYLPNSSLFEELERSFPTQ